MKQHVTYWRNQMKEGQVLVFGPVIDPAGVYGLGIISADNEAQVTAFTANDPAAAINDYEVYPMMAVTPDQL